jgi:hypothetical protein
MKTKTSIGMAFIVVGVAALIGAGVTYFQPQEAIRDQIEATFGDINFATDTKSEEGDIDLDFATAKKLVVNNQVGSIRVIGTSDGAKTGKLHYTKSFSGLSTERAQQYVKESQVEVKQEGDAVKVTTRLNHTNFKVGSLKIEIELTVPAELAVELQNYVGEVTTQNLQNNVSVNSDVGSVNIDGFKGEVRVDTKTGGVEVRGGQQIKLMDVQTNIGKLKVAIPADANLRVDARTDIGKILNDFNLPESERHNISGNIGDGSQGSVHLKTNTGEIELVKQ